MATTVATATEIICGALSEMGEASLISEAPLVRMYRLRKSFAAVQFDAAGKGTNCFPAGRSGASA